MLSYRDELAWSYAYRGDLLLDMKQPPQAADDYRQVLQLRQQLVKDSPDAEYRYRLAWFLANCQDAKLRDPAAAIVLAQQAVDLTPNSASYWNALGAAHYRAGHWDDSIRALNEAQKRRPEGHCLDWFFLAMAHWQAGEKQTAQDDCEQGVRWMDINCPANPEIKRCRDEVPSQLRPRDSQE